MKSVMPSTLASWGCKRRMMSLALTLPFLERLQVHLNPAAVHRGVDSVNADERRKALHRRIFKDDLCQGLLTFRHGSKRNRLRRLRYAENHPCILYREKPFRHDHVQPDGGDQRSDRDEQRGRLVTKHPAQRAAVMLNHRIEESFGGAIKPALRGRRPVPQQLGAHHGRQRERHNG